MVIPIFLLIFTNFPTSLMLHLCRMLFLCLSFSMIPSTDIRVDLIVAHLLKHLPRKALVLLLSIYNAMIFCTMEIIPNHFRCPPPSNTTFNILERIRSTTEVIPEHQLGFRKKHSIVQQCNRIVHKIMESFEGKKVCAIVFLDIQ